jgi:hypothetical protein
MVKKIMGLKIEAFHDDQDDAEPDTERRIDIVESHCEGELEPREKQR